MSTNETAAIETRQDKLLYVLFVLQLCMFEVHTLQLIQDHGFAREVLGAAGILRGEPEYRVFQNRLLGPAIVELTAKATGQPFTPTYALCLSLLIALSNVLCFTLVRRVTGKSITALAATTAFVVAVVFMQDTSWFFLWDAIDLSTMVVFAYAVFYAKNDLRILVPLFLVELLNRESAEFIALWIVIVAVQQLWDEASGRRFSKAGLAQLFTGSALLVGGTLWTKWLRTELFRRSFDSRIGLDLKHSKDGQWITLLENLRVETLTHEVASFVIAIIACSAIAYMLSRLFVLKGRDSYQEIIQITAMALAVWIFGRVDETRVWLEFIPFGIFFAFTIQPAIAENKVTVLEMSESDSQRAA